MNKKRTLYRTLLILGLGLLAAALALTACWATLCPTRRAGPWWASARAWRPWASPIC
jgi:hypothetical protein